MGKTTRGHRNYFYVENQSAQLKRDAENIAKNMGYGSLTAYLRSLIIQAVEKAPPHYKRDWKT